ncbi:MAG: GH1 family beta-glucosidase [Rhodoferax sp.]|uniref:GH1 family beta-glucosidase n=1 Tax=Rhodoferax sp. TaxID=50421 RepID=UPI0032678F23
MPAASTRNIPALNIPATSAIAQPEFLMGVATASYQIEGAADEDGRLQSIWDTYCDEPGRVLHGDTGDVACDHYHRWEADVDMIAGLGVDAYRLSIAWPRVMDEKGKPNAKGIHFYKKLLDALIAKGVQTYVTLYHWDLPQHLQDRGGWASRETAYAFADYADLMSRELAGKVTAWATLNEPWCSAYLGYGIGRHAPGVTDLRQTTQALHHLLLGHGLALAKIKANDPKALRGIVCNTGVFGPHTDSAADQDAAYLAYVQQNHWVFDPLMLGSYPPDLFRLWPGTEPLVLPGDMDIIATKMDFLGINYYFRTEVESDGKGGYQEAPHSDKVERTQMGWEVYPQGLTDLLVDFNARYQDMPPVYITENGMASDDSVGAEGVVDTQRIRFLERHLMAVDTAIKAGVDVRGYFIWSLMDNFEWAYGYERRFGITHVDYTTQVRTPKHSSLAVQAFLQQRKERPAR